MNLGTMTATLAVNSTGLVRAQQAMINMQKNVLNSVNGIQATLSSMDTRLSSVENKFKMVSSAASGAGRQMTSSANETVKAYQKISQGLTNIIGQLRSFGWLATTTLTMPIVMAGKASMTAYKDFEYSMLKIVGLVGIARSQVEQWSKDIRLMAKDIGIMPNKLAEALYFVTSSGFKTSEALNIVEMSAKGAAAGLGETKDIADLVTSVMNAYGQGNITAARTLDVLTAAVREGKGEATQYARVLGGVVPFAAQLGVQFEEVAGAVAAMTLEGASAANASTYLRNVFMKLLKPAKQSEDALKAMGSSSAELRNILEQRGVLASLMKIRTLTDKYGEDMMGKVIPNIRAMLAELMLTGKNFEYNAKVMDLVANSAGSLANAYQAVYNSVQKRLDRFSASVNDSMITLGESIKNSLIPVLESVAEKLQNVTKWFNGLSDSAKKATIEVSAFLAIIGPLSLVISTVGFGFKGVGKVLKWIIPTIVGLKDLIMFGSVATSKFSKALITLKNVASGAGKALKGFGEIGIMIAVFKKLYDWTIGYHKEVIAAAKANTTFQKTFTNINGEVKKLSEVKSADWATMDYKRLMEWNVWAGKSIKNTKEWIKYAYQLEGVTSQNASRYTEILAQGAKASEKDLKEANKAMGRSKQQIGIYQMDLLAGLTMLNDTGDALSQKLDQFGKLIYKPENGKSPNPAFGLDKVEQTMNLAQEQLDQITYLEEQYKSLGVSGYEGTSKKVEILNESLVTLIDNGWGASKEARQLARQIMDLGGLAGKAEKDITALAQAQKDYGDKMRVLDFMKEHAHKLGLEFDFIKEKTDLTRETLEKMLEHKAMTFDILVNAVGIDEATKFINDLTSTLKNMPPNVYPVTKALEDMGEIFKGINMESDFLGPNFDDVDAKIKGVEETIKKIIDATKGMQNLDTATLFDVGLSNAPSTIKVLDLIKFLLADLTRQLDEYKTIAVDNDFEKSRNLLENQAEAYGSVENQINLVEREIRLYERKLYDAAGAEKVNIDLLKEYSNQLNKARLKMIELQSSADLTYFTNLYKAFGKYEHYMGALGVQFDTVDAKLRQALSVPQTPENIKYVQQLTTEWGKLKTELEELDTVYDSLDSLSSIFRDIGDAIGGTSGELISWIGSLISKIPELIDLFQKYDTTIRSVTTATEAQSVAGQLNNMVTEQETITSGALSAIKGTETVITKASTSATQADAAAKLKDTAATLSNTTVTGINTAVAGVNATAKGVEAVAGATAAGAEEPFPYNIVAIALGVAAVIAALMTSIPKMKKGGVVPEGYPDDTFLTYLTSGEVVMPEKEHEELMKRIDSLGKDNNVTSKIYNYNKTTEHLTKTSKFKASQETNLDSLKKVIKSSNKAVSFSKLTKQTNFKRDQDKELIEFAESIAKMTNGGIVPKGYPNDTYPAMLTSGEKVLPPQDLNHLESAKTNIHITLDGEIKNRDLALVIRKIQEMN